MAQIKLNKHKVYNYIAEHMDWFKFGKKDELKYLPCFSICTHINRILEEDYKERTAESHPYDPPFIKLSGSTLTAMVYDGVLERKHNEKLKFYEYRPVLPIVEEYRQV